MKPMFYIFFSLLSFCLEAQITITNAIFPSVGDTILTITEDGNVNIDNSGNGGLIEWDFTSLNGTKVDTLIFYAAQDGQFFNEYPSADLVTFGPQGVETFYRKTSTSFQLLGVAGADDFGFGIGINTHYDPPYTIYQAPLDFIDVNQRSSNLSIPLSIADLPDSLFSDLGPGIDSIRIRFSLTSTNVVDAYGNLQMPMASYGVLREKRLEYTELNLDVHTFLGWTELPSDLIGGDFAADTTLSYHYLSNSKKGDLASVIASVEDESVESVTYQAPGGVVDIEELTTSSERVYFHAYPNPAFEDVYFECDNLPDGTYTIHLINLIGQTVWKETRRMSGKERIHLDLEDINKGTYLYSLTNADGKKIGTKRLVVIKP